MDQYYHRTNNLEPILSSGRIKALKHLAKSNPDLEVEVEHGASGSNLGGMYSNRSRMLAADAYKIMKDTKNVDDVFMTREVLPPEGYGKYVIEKTLKNARPNLDVNLIPNEYLSNRALSVNSNVKVYVPDEEHEELSSRFSSNKFIPMSKLKARQVTLSDRAKTLYGKLTKKADINTLYSGSERDIRKILSPNATIVGSEGIGIDVKGSSDRDILVPYRTRAGYNRLVSKLRDDGFGLQESEYNHRKRDGFKVYSYLKDGIDVDVALVHGGKAPDLANHVRKLRSTLSEDKKKSIISEKERLQNAWFFRDTRYKNYKRNLDRELGLTQFHE